MGKDVVRAQQGVALRPGGKGNVNLDRTLTLVQLCYGCTWWVNIMFHLEGQVNGHSSVSMPTRICRGSSLMHSSPGLFRQ